MDHTTEKRRTNESARVYSPSADTAISDMHRKVRSELGQAFQENRAFPFYPRDALVDAYRHGLSEEVISAELEALMQEIYSSSADGDANIERRLQADAMLATRITHGIAFIHRIIAQHDSTKLVRRRFVLIKERIGVPAIYHGDDFVSLTHIGLGPVWLESPSIYCGIRLFDLLAFQQETGRSDGFGLFKELLDVEESAIEVGISYTPPLLNRKDALTAYFIAELEHQTEELLNPPAKLPRKRVDRPFGEREKRRYFQMFDTRAEGSSLDFDVAAVVKATKLLERRARQYKRGTDRKSLEDVVELLVAASGHDVHEVRNQANIALERVFAPKEYDAPPATDFANIREGEHHRFSFALPKSTDPHILRLYKSAPAHTLVLENELEYEDIDLAVNPENGRYEALYEASKPGSIDYLVYRVGKKRTSWMAHPGCSGRLNVLPDVRGEIVLQIFTDVHGHTRNYWQQGDGHPGLVYNEYGEVIRLGRFSDVAAHISDLVTRYSITTIYLLGVFTRGKNREDWAPEATSASPFSPMSFRDFEESLGGEEEFNELLRAAHANNVKVVVDIMPHLNRTSEAVPDEWKVKCYDEFGKLVVRESTDGRFGSWGDGMLLNYREFKLWQWLGESIEYLIDMGVDGIRFDTAHAVPIMMKKNNFPLIYETQRSYEDMVKGTIIVNDREYDHLITTGYYDSACRELIACPFHTYLLRHIRRALHKAGKDFFLYIAECYWGRERYLARSGILPYNMALFKICESIVHGLSDVREIYHLYHDYFPSALPPGTEMVGILGNHDERRALNTFGKRGARAAIGLTCFLSGPVLDYEGSAEGESWKVFPDNIYVDWNQFEHASDRSMESFYREMYTWHRAHIGSGHLTWAENIQIAAALRFCDDGIWIGVFNFSDTNQHARVHFDRDELPISDDDFYRLVDPLYSSVTQSYVYYTGRELRRSTVDTVVSYTDRVKLLKLEKQDKTDENRWRVLHDSLLRLHQLQDDRSFASSYAFLQCADHGSSYNEFRDFLARDVLTQVSPGSDLQGLIGIGLKRAFYHLQKENLVERSAILEYVGKLQEEDELSLSDLGSVISEHNKRGPSVFISAEAEPFSKSGGLANVVFELPREMARLGEEVIVITPRYRHGSEYATQKMLAAFEKYKAVYTGQNLSFFIESTRYEVGVHVCKVEGVTYYLLDHHEFFDGLYWGYTSEERLRRRIALARSSAELLLQFGLKPRFVFTNDAFAGIFNGIVRADDYYANHPDLRRASFFHVIHNGGWQYFDAYGRYEGEKDLFSLFNVGAHHAGGFADPDKANTINCMATGIRFADKSFTVSPSYAEQLRVASDGIERVIGDVVGISNAIGVDFAKRADEHVRQDGVFEPLYARLLEMLSANKMLAESIAERYPEVLDGLWACEGIKQKKRREILQRARNKLLLQVEHGLDLDPDRKLAVMVHRVADQKGYQLLLEASQGIVTTLDYQIIAGGPVIDGDQQSEELGRGLAELGTFYPGSVSIRLGFLDVRMLLLGSDVFLMPSRHEPGGISQMEALACGCLVVARATGGLRDTIEPIQVKGTKISGNGTLFTDYTSGALYDAMLRFATFFDNADENDKYRARQYARASARYWETPALQYLEEIYDHKEMIRP